MKNVMITGANKGIGLETAKQLAQLGYYVFLGIRDEQRGNDTINKLKAEGITNIEFVKIDVTDIMSVKQAKTMIEAKIEALDVLINNAAITGEQPQNISTTDVELYKKVFDTNYFGAIRTTQQFLSLLQKSMLPRIINISSEVGSLTMHSSPGRNPNWNLYNAYGSSKTALNSFTVMLANELRNTKFRVNSVTPGYTATDLNQYQGFKTVEEGARPIVKLVTEANVETGKFFKDGGEVAW
ncbi:MAG TPA: SDR family NAD(P)-dependent oxidoreductase [Puia sp.]|nr:SDR family NAD(P)-dependent oxidoreductase [Puia sp.]